MTESKFYKKNVRPEFLVCCFLAIATLWVYFPVMGHDFINYDDSDYVVENYHVKRGITSDNIKWAFFSFHVSNWHPITWISHMLDCQFYGLNPGMHHSTSLIFHTINSILLFFVFFRTTVQIWPSFFVAAFFALHPMHVESVAWIAERKDVLSTFFMMITFLFYISYSKTLSRISYWSAVSFFTFGLMSKPMIVTLPFLLLLFDYWPFYRFSFNNIPNNFHRKMVLTAVFNTPSLTANRAGVNIYSDINNDLFSKNCMAWHSDFLYLCKNNAVLVVEKIPFFLLSIVSSFIAVRAQGKGGAIVPTTVYPIYVRFCNAVVSYFEYIRKMLYPTNLAVPYPYPEKIPWLYFLVSLAMLILISAFAVYKSKKKPYIIVGWLWYMGTLVPVIGIVQVGAQAMADRYSYIPYIGLFISVFWYLNDLSILSLWIKRFNDVVRSGLLLILIIMILLTRMQIAKWSDSITLFQHALKATSNNYIAHLNLGHAIIGREDIPLEKAAEHFAEAIRIKPDFAIAHNNLGVYWASIGDENKALYSYSQAVKYQPDNSSTYNSIGNIYFRKCMYDDALDYYTKAMNIDPVNCYAYNGIGAVYAKKGNVDKAIYFFSRALDIEPGNLNAKASLMVVKKKRQEIR